MAKRKTYKAVLNVCAPSQEDRAARLGSLRANLAKTYDAWLQANLAYNLALAEDTGMQPSTWTWKGLTARDVVKSARGELAKRKRRA